MEEEREGDAGRALGACMVVMDVGEERCIREGRTWRCRGHENRAPHDSLTYRRLCTLHKHLYDFMKAYFSFPRILGIMLLSRSPQHT